MLIKKFFLSLLILMAGTAYADEDIPQAKSVTTPILVPAYQPPDDASIPNDKFGEMVRLGKNIFTHTGQYAGKYVGNKMACVNCHLNAGRLQNSAPLWAAWVKYPAYRNKNKMVNTMEERLQGCFKYSMNGIAPAADSTELKALMSYAFWLAKGAPTGVTLPGRGFPKLKKPAKQADFKRGLKVYTDNCLICHGKNGQGTLSDGEHIFPPLWGKDSFNWGAGMHRVNTAAAFIRANMPLGKGGSLSVQDAWDVAYYINSHERPQDPRFNGDLQETDKQYHKHQCRYADKQNDYVLGK